MKHFEEWIRKQRHRDINETEDTQRQPSTFSYNEFWPTMGGQVINRMWPTQIKMYILLYSHLIKLLKYPFHRCKNDLSIPIQSCMSSSMTPLPHTQHPFNNSYFLGGSVVKNPPANAGDMSSVPESGRSPGEDDGNSLQYSCLENPVDREAWKATIHGIAKSRTWLNVHACIITGTWPCVCGKVISLCRRCGLKLTEEYERKKWDLSL